VKLHTIPTIKTKGITGVTNKLLFLFSVTSKDLLAAVHALVSGISMFATAVLPSNSG